MASAVFPRSVIQKLIYCGAREKNLDAGLSDRKERESTGVIRRVLRIEVPQERPHGERVMHRPFSPSLHGTKTNIQQSRKKK